MGNELGIGEDRLQCIFDTQFIFLFIASVIIQFLLVGLITKQPGVIAHRLHQFF